MLRLAGAHTSPLYTPQPCSGLRAESHLFQQPDFFFFFYFVPLSGVPLKLYSLHHHPPSQLFHLPKPRLSPINHQLPATPQPPTLPILSSTSVPQLFLTPVSRSMQPCPIIIGSSHLAQCPRGPSLLHFIPFYGWLILCSVDLPYIPQFFIHVMVTPWVAPTFWLL